MKHTLATALTAAMFLGGSAVAQPIKPLSAQASDPKAMGWMQGSPPPPDKTISFTHPDYFAFP